MLLSLMGMGVPTKAEPTWLVYFSASKAPVGVLVAMVWHCAKRREEGNGAREKKIPSLEDVRWVLKADSLSNSGGGKE